MTTPTSQPPQSNDPIYATHAAKVKPLRILVVDDHTTSRMLLSYILGQAKHLSHPCKNEDRALAMADEKPIQLFILDVHMPSISGAELLKLLRNLKPEYQNTPAILISADHDPNLHYLANQIPNTIFTPKPISPANILQAIEKLMPAA